MFEPQTTTFLESGCALIVGVVDPHGAPHASRGWGLDVLPEVGAVRLLLDADDAPFVTHLEVGARLAITGADVRTLRSVQLKGRVLAVEPATPADDERVARFCEAFFTDIVETDGQPRTLLERLVPARYLACAMAVDQRYDQTPGPGAGGAMTGAEGPT